MKKEINAIYIQIKQLIRIHKFFERINNKFVNLEMETSVNLNKRTT